MKKIYKVLKSNKIIESNIPGKFAGVKTTKIFGRLNCGAGKSAKKENRVFFLTWDDAIKHGYRPCKICKPVPDI